MWNKLLLTEFVIYLCCLGGLMPLVFWVLQIFLFLFFPSFFCHVCWCAPTWLFGNGRLMTKSVECHGRITTEKAPFRVCVVVILQVSHRCCWQHLSVILRDTVGLGSQTSQAATAPSLPCTDESWLPGSAALRFYLNHFWSDVGEGVLWDSNYQHQARLV